MEQVRGGLSVYLDHVKANPAKNQAFVRAGIGSDPEVIEVMEETRRAVWESLLAGMGATEDEHLLRFAVRGWVRFVEVTALDWAQSGQVEKEALIDVCLAVLGTAIERSRRAR